MGKPSRIPAILQLALGKTRDSQTACPGCGHRNKKRYGMHVVGASGLLAGRTQRLHALGKREPRWMHLPRWRGAGTSKPALPGGRCPAPLFLRWLQGTRHPPVSSKMPKVVISTSLG